MNNSSDRPCRKQIDYSVVAVNCKGITKSYGSGTEVVRALNGIDLDVYPGELMMLVGPSGCGKTTLISILAGILDQDQGDCVVFGRDYNKMSASEKTRYRGDTIGFVFQAFNLIPTLSAVENVAIPLLINGTKRSVALGRARDVLAKVGLANRLKALPAQLSGGQQQRVAIARAFVHDPKLIVCDEPTSALDHETGHKIMEILGEVALCAGRALVIVTHDARIFSFADKIARMDDGRIIEIVGSPEQLSK